MLPDGRSANREQRQVTCHAVVARTGRPDPHRQRAHCPPLTWGCHPMTPPRRLTHERSAREPSVEPYLFAATTGVPGNVGQATSTEGAVLRPLTPYGATKAAAEMLIGAYANCYGIKGAALRFSNVYGPGMAEKDSFIPRL